jgi:transposase
MRKTEDGRRVFDREFKIAAVRRVLAGEEAKKVAESLGIRYALLWRWKKRVVEEGEDHLYEIGRGGMSSGQRKKIKRPRTSEQERIAELERLVGRQQMEIRFLDKALRQVEELRQQKKGAGGKASSKR